MPLWLVLLKIVLTMFAVCIAGLVTVMTVVTALPAHFPQKEKIWSDYTSLWLTGTTVGLMMALWLIWR